MLDHRLIRPDSGVGHPKVNWLTNLNAATGRDSISAIKNSSLQRVTSTDASAFGMFTPVFITTIFTRITAIATVTANSTTAYLCQMKQSNSKLQYQFSILNESRS